MNRFSLFALNSILVILFCVATIKAECQWYDPEKVDKKARLIYEQAYDAAVQSRYEESLKHLEEALLIDPKYVEVYLSRAGIHADMRNYTSSVNDFSNAFSLDPEFSSTYLLPYSISLAGTGSFDKALEAIDQFLKNPKLNEQSKKAGAYRKSTYEFALDYKRQHPNSGYQFLPVNMGPEINTPMLEYFPSMTIDGKTMIFNRRVDGDEDFYESHLVNNQWEKATPVTGKINTNLNEGAQNISQDGDWLIFTGCNYPEGAGSCDLYIAYRTKSGGWTEPENLGFTLNSDAWESTPSLSPDKRDLYFSSNREGGYGAKDIWVSHREKNNKWGKPVNLGPIINTDGNETCPFIHADNQTLYFNSNGHLGYGKADIFLSRRKGENSWSDPLNLGYPINTIDDEGSMVVAADGITAFYDSDRGSSLGGLDIYSFQLPADVKAIKTRWVRGRVYDKVNKAGLPSTVELTDINTRNLISRLQTDEDGNYLITLPEGKSYAFHVNRKGYLLYSEHYDFDGSSNDSVFIADIPLEPFSIGASVILQNIFFANNAYSLTENSFAELDKIVDLLKENPQLKIQVSGHTDNVGKKEANMLLSTNRAKAVMAYFLNHGIVADRLSAKGFADMKPIAGNDTDQGKSLNRRTEINVTSF